MVSPRSITDAAMQKGLSELVTGEEKKKHKPAHVSPTMPRKAFVPANPPRLRSSRVESGEMGARKSKAEEKATAKGHQMGAWKKRGDVHGRQDAWCMHCNRIATVCVSEPYMLPLIYGDALKVKCEHDSRMRP